MKEILIFGGLTVAILAGVALHYSWVSKNNPEQPSDMEHEITVDAEGETQVEIEQPVADEGPDELQIEDIVVGTGAPAINGARVSVHYTGTLLDGSKFDSSLDRGTPFEFVLGSGQVIQGWDMGVLDMKVGGKRKLVIPADLAYGKAARPGIPANSVLVFEVELLDVK